MDCYSKQTSKSLLYCLGHVEILFMMDEAAIYDLCDE